MQRPKEAGFHVELANAPTKSNIVSAIIDQKNEMLDKGVPVKKIRDVRGIVYMAAKGEPVHFDVAGEWDYDTMKTDKRRYAEAFGIQYRNTDAVTGKAMIEYYDNKQVVQNPPMPPLERKELDAVPLIIGTSPKKYSRTNKWIVMKE